VSGRRLPHPNDRIVIATYLSDRSSVRAAKRLGISPATVNRVLNRHRIARRRATDQKIIATYRSGLSLARTGDQFGLSTSAVNRVLDRHDVPRRPQSTRTTFLTKPLPPPRTLLTVVEVADLLGVSKPTVYRKIDSGEIKAARVTSPIMLIRASTLRAFPPAPAGRSPAAGGSRAHNPRPVPVRPSRHGPVPSPEPRQ